MIREILSFIDDAEKGAQHVAALVDIGARLGAHIKIGVLTAAPMMLPELAPFGSLYLPEIALRADGELQIGRARGLVAAAADRVDIWGYHDSVGWLAADVRDSRQIADLIAIGDADSWNVPWLRRKLIETLLLSAGTPILLLPGAPKIGRVRHAVLGWKPSAQANRVVHDLVALAEPGARIDVVTVGPAPEGEPAELPGSGIKRHLARHGFAVEMFRINDGDEPEDQLQAFAVRHKADLLAVGGFAHTRIREIVLGGVTRALIDSPFLPVLMAH
ncbi:MAG: universal stress protein [Pseudomonadota bacterium]